MGGDSDSALEQQIDGLLQDLQAAKSTSGNEKTVKKCEMKLLSMMRRRDAARLREQQRRARKAQTVRLKGIMKGLQRVV